MFAISKNKQPLKQVREFHTSMRNSSSAVRCWNSCPHDKTPAVGETWLFGESVMSSHLIDVTVYYRWTFINVSTYNLGQNQGWENGRFGSCAASSLIWEGGFILFKIVASSAAGITVLYLRTGGRMGQRKGHDLLFLFGWDEMVTPKSDCHLNPKYMHMIGDLYLKVASERKQKTENIVGSM